jgi:deazaflavin-dependent oxidoreductase (nitroreductase family)
MRPGGLICGTAGNKPPPLSVHGFRASVAYAALGRSGGYVAADVVINGLPRGRYRFARHVHNDHPLVDIVDENGLLTTFGQSLFATYPLASTGCRGCAEQDRDLPPGATHASRRLRGTPVPPRPRGHARQVLPLSQGVVTVSSLPGRTAAPEGGLTMPLPMWVAQVNKRLFNRIELRRGARPVLTHVGRSSGKTYHTPLDAHRVDGGFIFILMYGSGSDWVRNVLAAGTASVKVGSEEFELESPRVVSKDAAWQQLPEKTKAPPGFLKVTEYLQMDIRP